MAWLILNRLKSINDLSCIILKNNYIGLPKKSFSCNVKPTNLMLDNQCLLPQHKKSFLRCEQLDIAQGIRTATFFNKYSGDFLWKGVTSVSNQGRMKGRASRVRKKIDFNRGQIIGRGPVKVILPGLNEQSYNDFGPSKEIKIVEGVDDWRLERLKKTREMQQRSNFRRRLDPLDRGWTGSKWPGRSIGPPDPVNGDYFDGFETIVLEQKRVHHMTRRGRAQPWSIFVVTGNRNGIIGLGLGKHPNLRNAMGIAKKKAGKNLIEIPRYNEHTVFHNFWTTFFNSKLMIRKQPEGVGLIGDNTIKEICKAAGIKDLSCESEGAFKNIQNLAKSFILGLIRQKSHQELSNEKQLYLVEMKEECLNYPTVVATPENNVIREEKDISESEDLDFDQITMEEKLPLKRTKFKSKFYFTRDYNTILLKVKNERVRSTVNEIIVDHGSLENFYTEAYKEFVPEFKVWKKEEIRKVPFDAQVY